MVLYWLVCPYRHKKMIYDSNDILNLWICSTCGTPLEYSSSVKERNLFNLLFIILISPLLGIGLFIYWLLGKEFVRFWK